MSDNKEYKTTFEVIITKHSWWARLQGSQFVTMIATFVGQMVENAKFFAERCLQEAHLSTATKRSSILAAAEDKGYIGRKIMPSTGTSTVKNLTESVLSLPRETPLISNAALEYITATAIEIPAKSIVEVPITQLVLRVFKVAVSQEQKFLEVILPKNVSAKAHKIDVYVAPPNGASELWEKRYMFRRTGARDKCYAELYKPTEQLGVRFGNGINGRIPSVGSEITLKVWTTEGDTTLINNQPLELTGSLAYLNSSLEIKTLTPIVGGAKAESDEETRAGALYVTPFDNQIVWDDDYQHFIKQNIANITWVKSWGEQEQERQNGTPDLDFINKIYVSAYSTKLPQEQLEVLIVSLLQSTNYLNKRYQYIPARNKPFKISIVGTATGEKDLVQVKKVIKETIDATYGQNPSKERPKELLEKDLNSMVRGLNLLYDFSLDWSEYPRNILLEDYVYIDVELSVINISYLGN